MVKLHGIAANTGMISRTTDAKVALGAKVAQESKSRPKEEKKDAKKPAQKPKKKEKSGKMDDDSSSEDGKIP